MDTYQNAYWTSIPILYGCRCSSRQDTHRVHTATTTAWPDVYTTKSQNTNATTNTDATTEVYTEDKGASEDATTTYNKETNDRYVPFYYINRGS